MTVPEANRHQFPNLDTLAMLRTEAGMCSIPTSTAQEYLTWAR